MVEMVEWTCEGDLKCRLYLICRVDVNGFPARYQEGAYSVYADRVDCTINMGGTAEVNNSFCPWSGAEAFFIIYYQI